MAGTILMPAGLQDCGGPQAVQHPVGTGPFLLGSRKHTGDIVLERFEKYWRKDGHGDPLPYLAGLRFTVIPTADEAIAQLQEGRIHLYETRRRDVDQVVEDKGGRLALRPEYAEHPIVPGISVNPQQAKGVAIFVRGRADGLLSTRTGRAALSRALDRARLARESDAISGPIDRLLGPRHLGYDPLMDPVSSGPPRSGGRPAPATFRLAVPKFFSSLADALEPNLRASGLSVRFAFSSIKEFESIIRSGRADAFLGAYGFKEQGDEPVGLVGFVGALSTGFIPALTEARERPGSLYALAQKVLATRDREARGRLYREIEARLIGEGHVIPLGVMPPGDGWVHLSHRRLRGHHHPKTRRNRSYTGKGSARLYLLAD